MIYDYDYTDQVSFNCPKCSRRSLGLRHPKNLKLIGVVPHYIRFPHCSMDDTVPVKCIFSLNSFEEYYLDPDLLDLQDLVSVSVRCPNSWCEVKDRIVEKRVAESRTDLREHICIRKVNGRREFVLKQFWNPDVPQDNNAYSTQGSGK